MDRTGVVPAVERGDVLAIPRKTVRVDAGARQASEIHVVNTCRFLGHKRHRTFFLISFQPFHHSRRIRTVCHDLRFRLGNEIGIPLFKRVRYNSALAT